jgi:AraC-like DNA-binding protein
LKFLHQLFLILINGGIVLGIFIVLLLNHKNVRRNRANLFLSILLIALSFSIAHILYAGSVINHFSSKAYAIGDPTFLLIGPLLWFYVCELTGEKVKLSFLRVFHFIPFLLVILLSLVFGALESQAYIDFIVYHTRLANSIFWIIATIQFSWYQYAIHRKWISYGHLLRQEVSNTEDINIGWVKFFTGIFLCINILFLFSLFATIHLNIGHWLPKATALIFSLSILSLGYKGILQKDIFQSSSPSVADHSPKESAAANVLHDQKQLEELQAYMENQKPYLDPELSLSMLAKNLGMSRSHLSQLINAGTGTNFYDFVNRYRVEEVKRLMQDPSMKNFNMLGIALEAGFKSKSTFNLIFKRFTGLTPTAYLKSLRH